jgi:FAD/FMN-containing dehydrogenase
MRVAADPAGIRHELSRHVEGEVWTEEDRRDLYSRAACVYRRVPLAVVCPRHAGDVAAALRFASREELPVTARGAGSGVTGGSVGGGIVLDFSIHMDRVLEVGDGWARVEPGCLRQALVERLEEDGRTFAPDPSSGAWCTLGGMAATNASGPRSHRHGATRDHLLEVEAVGAGGELLRFGPSGNGDETARWLAELLREGAAEIAADRPRTRKCSSGYHLWDLEEDGRIHLERLFCGSEGTLAVATALRVRTVPLPAAAATAVLYPRDAVEAAAAADELAGAGLSAIEMLDDLVLEAVRLELGDRSPFPAGAGSALFLEAEGETPGEARALLRSAVGALGGVEAHVAEDAAAAREMWALRDEASPTLKRASGRRRPARFVEDGCVPPGRLADYVRGMRALLQEHGREAPLFGHAGDGHLHCNPRLDLGDPDDLRRLDDLVEAQTELLCGMGGVPSGEHGDGRLRAGALPRIFPRSHAWMRRVKELFDPAGVLNPRAKVTPPRRSPGPASRGVDPLAEDLRMDGVEQRQELMRRLTRREEA